MMKVYDQFTNSVLWQKKSAKLLVWLSTKQLHILRFLAFWAHHETWKICQLVKNRTFFFSIRRPFYRIKLSNLFMMEKLELMVFFWSESCNKGIITFIIGSSHFWNFRLWSESSITITFLLYSASHVSSCCLSSWWRRSSSEFLKT